MLARYAFEECVEDWKDFHVAVVVDGNLIVGIHVEGVYHGAAKASSFAPYSAA